MRRIMLRNGVMPMPPAMNTDSGAASSSGKLLRGRPIVSVSPARSVSCM